jgi:hypothetical protein
MAAVPLHVPIVCAVPAAIETALALAGHRVSLRLPDCRPTSVAEPFSRAGDRRRAPEPIVRGLRAERIEDTLAGVHGGAQAETTGDPRERRCELPVATRAVAASALRAAGDAPDRKPCAVAAARPRGRAGEAVVADHARCAPATKIAGRRPGPFLHARDAAASPAPNAIELALDRRTPTASP